MASTYNLRSRQVPPPVPKEPKKRGEAKKTEALKEELRASGTQIRWIPRRQLTEELCLIALSHPEVHKRCSLYDIPKTHRTPAVCHVAVTQRGSDLSAVPLELRSYTLCAISAIRRDKTHCNLAVIPFPYRTREICDALMAYSASLNYDAVPEDLKKEYPPPATEEYVAGVHATLRYP